MEKNRKVYLIAYLVVISMVGIILIVISLLPFKEVKALFDFFAIDGDVKTFSMKQVMLLRFAGIFTCLVGGLVYIFKNKFLQYMPEFKIADFLMNPKNILDFTFNVIRNLREAARKEDKIHTYTFILLILLAISVRIFYLFKPIGPDETNIFESRIYHSLGLQGLINLFTGYQLASDHMFNTVLSYLTFKLLGSEQSMWTYRLPALIAGILLVPATYIVVRIFYNKHSALLASGMVAASSYLIRYSTESRGYSFMCLFFFLILALGAYLKENNKIAGWHLFAILSALGFYTIPIMLYPYGIVITWLTLSTIVKDIHDNRSYFIKNIFISIVITVILTSLLYSPIVFFGYGFKVFYYYSAMSPATFGEYINNFWDRHELIWNIWNKDIPDIILYLLVAGFFISVFFHKKLSVHRFNIALAACIWLIPVMLFSRVVSLEHRHLIFIFPLFLGLASSGLTYIFSPIEKVFIHYKPAMYSLLAITVFIVLIANTVQSKPHHLANKKFFFDDNSKYNDMVYIADSLNYHRLSELYGMNLHPGVYGLSVPADIFGRALPPENYMDLYNMPKTLIIFRSSLKNDFWMRSKELLKRKFFFGDFINSDLKSYLSKDSRICHSLFLISNESVSALEDLLKDKGLSVSDYSVPELIHRYQYVNLYKITREKNCMKYSTMEKKAVSMAYNWKAYILRYREIMGRLPGDSNNDGFIGNAPEEQTQIASAASEMAGLENLGTPHENPLSIGEYRFWVYIGYDSTANNNVMVICKTVNCAKSTNFTNDELKLMESIDIAFDGNSDAGKGQFRASTTIELMPDLSTKVNDRYAPAVTKATVMDNILSGSSTNWATSHSSAVWFFTMP
ncbi:MAG: glycosyltransferase family 39 protein [Nitrospirae bacterium]|nr:glycosyltransferase family 39 protein [Nitrospirota bacterium]